MAIISSPKLDFDKNTLIVGYVWINLKWSISGINWDQVGIANNIDQGWDC